MTADASVKSHSLEFTVKWWKNSMLQGSFGPFRCREHAERCAAALAERDASSAKIVTGNEEEGK